MNDELDIWKPMADAPQDGTRFIALIPRQTSRFSRESPFIPVECYWEWGMKVPRFIYNGWSSSAEPTLWAHLPPTTKGPHHE